MLTTLQPDIAEDTPDELLDAEWALEDCENLYHLAKYTLGFDKLTPHPHADLCDFITNSGKYANRLHNNWKLILVPRGTYKTSIASIAYTIQRILRDSNIRILLDGETYAKSCDTLRAIKGILATNPLFRSLHGALNEPVSQEAVEYVRANRVLPWNEDSIIVGTRTDFSKVSPTISVGGVDITKVGMHYDLVIGDDYHSEKNITTKEQIEKVIRHIQLMTAILDPGTSYVFTATIWDMQDAYNWIIRDIEGLRITKPGIYRGKQFDIMIYPWRWGSEGDYTYFAPKIWNEDTIIPMRRMLSPYQFSCQLENNPIDEASAVFKRSWLQYIDSRQLPQDDIVRFMSIDPAIGLGDKRDYSAIVTVAYDKDMKRYLLDVHHGRWNEEQLVEHVIEDYKKYKPLQIGFESVAGFKAYETVFREICRRKRVYLPIIFMPRDSTNSKVNRIRALAPMFKEGSFYIVRGCRGEAEFMDEYLRYGHSRSFDDVLDALADVEAMKWFPGDPGNVEMAYEPADQITGY